MKRARSSHTATLLPNGKLLVAGGFGANTAAELYDPATDTWTVTGSLRVARAGACATLLPNGKVLVTGGGKRGEAFDSTAKTELYDPATGKWTLTGSMNYGRSLGSTATLLPNGKVLVAQGDSCELYDPDTGTWTTSGSIGLDLAQSGYTATLLPSGKVLAAGVTSSQLYDPATGTWTNTGALNERSGERVATLLPNGKVLIAAGGRLSTELYDPASGNWSPTGSMTWDRRWTPATLLWDGQVLVAAGYSGTTSIVIPSGELYDPKTGIWTEISMSGRVQHTATLLPDGRVLLAGGWGLALLSSAELYVPDNLPPVLTLLREADQSVSLSWTGAGVLEQTGSLTSPDWQPAPSQANPQTTSATEAMRFYRVKAE